jgi:purine-binding chemotaxis protein CheW
MTLPVDALERSPGTLDPRWREVSGGIFRLDGTLLVVLDVERLLDFMRRAEAS